MNQDKKIQSTLTNTTYRVNLIKKKKHLSDFFRNLLLGENRDLSNKNLHIRYNSDYNKEKDDEHSHKTGQVHTENTYIKKIVEIIGNKQLSAKSIMDFIGLKSRDNFINRYLKPAISEGYICLLYHDSHRHPKQKYLLTAKGISLWNEMMDIL